MVITPDWESKYRIFYFCKENSSLISLILDTKSGKHEYHPSNALLSISLAPRVSIDKGKSRVSNNQPPRPPNTSTKIIFWLHADFLNACRLSSEISGSTVKINSQMTSIFNTKRFRVKKSPSRMVISTILRPAVDPRFTRGGCQPKGDAELLFGQILQKTTWKWRKFDRGRASKFVLCQSAEFFS